MKKIWTHEKYFLRCFGTFFRLILHRPCFWTSLLRMRLDPPSRGVLKNGYFLFFTSGSSMSSIRWAEKISVTDGDIATVVFLRRPFISFVNNILLLIREKNSTLKNLVKKYIRFPCTEHGKALKGDKSSWMSECPQKQRERSERILLAFFFHVKYGWTEEN